MYIICVQKINTESPWKRKAHTRTQMHTYVQELKRQGNTENCWDDFLGDSYKCHDTYYLHPNNSTFHSTSGKVSCDPKQSAVCFFFKNSISNIYKRQYNKFDLIYFALNTNIDVNMPSKRHFGALQHITLQNMAKIYR